MPTHIPQCNSKTLLAPTRYVIYIYIVNETPQMHEAELRSVLCVPLLLLSFQGQFVLHLLVFISVVIFDTIFMQNLWWFVAPIYMYFEYFFYYIFV